MRSIRRTRLLAWLVALALPTGVASAQAGSGRITGRVTESKLGQPVNGASVRVVGTNIGAVTRADGQYTIPGVAAGIQRIRVSMIGYSPREDTVVVTAGQDVTANFDLEQIAVTLQTQVVIGYGAVERADLTGSVSSVSLATDRVPTVSLDQAIQGRAAGVQVTQASSAPGGGITIRIRGASSLQGNNEPLYVIDGFPIENDPAASSPGDAGRSRTVPSNPLASLSPDDIEAIEILKDASSTAIYGSRGANGVVLITTKRGTSGRPRVTLDSYSGMQTVAKRYDLLNAREFAEFANEWAASQSTPLPPIYPDPASLGTGTDWQDQIFRSAPIRNLQMSLSGGTTGANSTRYIVSGGVFDQEGVVHGSDFRRISVRGNLEQGIGERFRLSSNLALTRVNSASIPTDGGSGSNQNAGAVAGALQYYPTLPVRQPDSSYTLLLENSPSTLNPSTVPNPVSLVREVNDDLGDTRVLANLFGEYTIIDGLTLRISGGADYSARFRDTYYPRTTLFGRNVEGEARRARSDHTNLLNENTLTFAREFGTIHELNAVGGYTRQQQTTTRSSMLNSNFVSDITGYDDIGSGARLNGPGVGSGYQQWSLVSYLGRVSYTLLGRYLATVTARRDGSSRFGPSNKWGNFPSAALAWRLSDESFMQDVPGLDLLKLRASYGLAGNTAIRPYESSASLCSQRYAFGGTPTVGYYPCAVGNPDLSWETTRQVDYGIDLGFLDGRIDLTADYYRKRTEDLLLLVQLPLETGFGSALQNKGAIENRGFEFAVNLNILDGAGESNGLTWTSSFNYSRNRNKVLSLDDSTQELFAERVADDLALNGTIVRVGEPIGVFYGYKTAGVIRTAEEAAAYTAQVKPSSGTAWQPGDLRIVNVDTSGTTQVINSSDRTILGNPAPKFTIGWSNSVSYRWFELSSLIDGSYGSTLLNLNMARLEAGSPRTNILRDRWVNRWTPTNPNGRYARIGATPGFVGADITSDMLESGSYTRLRNITLAVSAPERWLTRTRLSRARVYVTGTNLITWTDYSGFNPDVSSISVSNVNRGVDVGSYPLARAVTLGLNLSY